MLQTARCFASIATGESRESEKVKYIGLKRRSRSGNRRAALFSYKREKSMEKKKSAFIITIITIPVIATAFLGGIWFQKRSEKSDSKAPLGFEDILNNQIHLSDEEKEDVPLFLSAMNDSCLFKVNDYSETELNGEKAYLVSIELTYPDVADDIRKYLEADVSTSFDEQKVNYDIAELVKNASRSSADFEMYFISKDNDFVPIFSDEIIDTMYGGIYSGYYSELEKFGRKISSDGGVDNEQ